MATFTAELRNVVDKYDIGLRDYPIFNADYREKLNKKIVDTYWYYEIGFETIHQFIHQLNVRMRNIMPPMNDLYKSTQMQFDPLHTISIRTVSSTENENDSSVNSAATNKGSTESTNESEDKSRAVNSMFPQAMLQDNGDYATSASDSNSLTKVNASGKEVSESNAATNSKEQNKGNLDSLTSGYNANPADLLMRYRESILNVDLMVIDQLADLFMMILNTPDAYTASPAWSRLDGGYGYGYGSRSLPYGRNYMGGRLF